MRNAYHAWETDNPPNFLSDAIDEWSAEAERRREPWSDALDAWMAATDAIAENADALLLAEFRFSLLKLTNDAGDSPLSELATDDANAETVAQAEVEAETLAQAHAVTLADTAAKSHVAEDLRPAAIEAYRAAAKGWRSLIEPKGEH